MSNSDTLRSAARQIASSGTNPRAIWGELQKWSSVRGPLAVKCAMIEFVSIHGTNPEAAVILPELLRSQILSPIEKNDLLARSHLSNQTSPNLMNTQRSSLTPKMATGSEKLSLSLRPQDQIRFNSFTPLSPSMDHSRLRDMPLRIHESMGRQLLPPFSANRPTENNPQRSTALGANHGEHLVRSLVERVRAHGHDEHPVQVMSASIPAKKSKRTISSRIKPKQKSKKLISRTKSRSSSKKSKVKTRRKR